MDSFGATFEWREGADSSKRGLTTWALFKETSKYFAPSDKQFMIDYRVQGLTQLLAQMKAAGITPVDSVEKVSYGSFVHLMDPKAIKLNFGNPLKQNLHW